MTATLPARPEVTMPSRSHNPKTPRLPNLDSAEKLVTAQWLNPTEQGLQAARRSLVRRMWQARRAHAPHLRERLRTLYTWVLRMQAAREWEVDARERDRRQRTQGDPAQYSREQIQQQGSSALVAISGTQVPFTAAEGQQQQERQRPPIHRTHTRVVHDQLTSKDRRERERRARAYAEQYYQALRDWKVYTNGPEEVLSRRDAPVSGSAGARMRPILGNWASSPIRVQEYLVHMPPSLKRVVPEPTLAALCNQSPVLSAIREGRTLSSLVDPRGGWHQHKDRAMQLAHAVLTLAYHLGDERAQEHLRSIPIAEIQHSA